MELAAAGEDMKKLREIARVHIARCEAGDMQAIKELADRLDGRPAQILEHSGPDSNPIDALATKIVNEIVYMPPRTKSSRSRTCPNRRSKSPSCEAMGMEAADPILKIKTAAVIAGQLFRVPRSLS